MFVLVKLSWLCIWLSNFFLLLKHENILVSFFKIYQFHMIFYLDCSSELFQWTISGNLKVHCPSEIKMFTPCETHCLIAIWSANLILCLMPGALSWITVYIFSMRRAIPFPFRFYSKHLSKKLTCVKLFFHTSRIILLSRITSCLFFLFQTE